MTYQQSTLPFGFGEPSPRALLVARWNQLVRIVLPNLAKQNDWPIHLDHCFMRVCLDTAFGGPWHRHIKRPAITHLTDEQLSAAIGVGDNLVRHPETLNALNRQSIDWRQTMRTGAGATKS